MYDGTLKDLELAGVRWELTEVPMVTLIAEQATMREIAKQSPAPDIICTNPNPVSGLQGRVATSIVPPISPMQTISIDTVRAMAARPNDVQALLRMIAEFNHPLRSGVTNVVLPHIAPNPNGLVVVTDIPSADDDKNGRIMSGATGELLDKMIGAIGMSRDMVSVVPMLFWRTPGGRGPVHSELELSRPFVDRILEMLHPRMILTMGTLPALELASVQLPRGHGVVVDLPNEVKLVPIFHPNYLMLKPVAKRDAWDALKNVQNLLKTV